MHPLVNGCNDLRCSKEGVAVAVLVLEHLPQRFSTTVVPADPGGTQQSAQADIGTRSGHLLSGGMSSAVGIHDCAAHLPALHRDRLGKCLDDQLCAHAIGHRTAQRSFGLLVADRTQVHAPFTTAQMRDVRAPHRVRAGGNDSVGSTTVVRT